MQFQVPQFIEVEDKIVGPLTLKQFGYLAVAFIIIFAFFFILKIWAWLILALIVAGLGAALAFVKYNGRPLTVLIRSVANYFWRPRLYSWQTRTPAAAGNRLSQLELQLKTSSRPIPRRERGWLGGWLGRLLPGSEEKFEVLRKLTGEKEVARRVDYR